MFVQLEIGLSFDLDLVLAIDLHGKLELHEAGKCPTVQSGMDSALQCRVIDECRRRDPLCVPVLERAEVVNRSIEVGALDCHQGFTRVVWCNMRGYAGHGRLQDGANDVRARHSVTQARPSELPILVQYLHLEVSCRRNVGRLAQIDGVVCSTMTWRYRVLLITCLLIWWVAVL